MRRCIQVNWWTMNVSCPSVNPTNYVMATLTVMDFKMATHVTSLVTAGNVIVLLSFTIIHIIIRPYSHIQNICVCSCIRKYIYLKLFTSTVYVFRFFLSTGKTHDIVQCVGGAWTRNVTCERVTCGAPLLPYARIDCPNGFLYEDVCKFNCRTPAIMRGTHCVVWLCAVLMSRPVRE